MIIVILFSILLLLYCGLQCYLWIVWRKRSLDQPACTTDISPDVTILIPVRNEEGHLENCLLALDAQEYRGSGVQVILIDDHSTDRSPDIARNHRNVELIRLPEGVSGKKMAIQEGVKSAKGQIILTIDGDCLVGKEWLETMVGAFSQGTDNLVTGPVWMIPVARSFIEKYQEMEQAALNVLTYSGVTSGLVLSANGANMAYSRSLFDRLDPYADNQKIPSGDDVFFVQKLHLTGGRIRYVANPDALVFTDPEPTFSRFINQRMRWAGKSSRYSHLATRLYLNLFGALNISFLVMGIAGIWFPLLYSVALTGLVIKFCTDYLIIHTGMRWGQRPVCWQDGLKASLFQIAYVNYMAWLMVLGRKSVWKGRVG